MIVPLFKVSNMAEAIKHYTEVLDFVMTDPNDHVDSPVVDLGRDGWNMQITTSESERLFGSVVYFWVEDVDALFAKYLARGLDISRRAGSPVHQGPVNQTWGRREFYVTDADGNTIRFCKLIE
ncbi:VOC family protein [Dyadobacter sp. BHUBP1]|uniref:VOC family protein n=1 Tax=Dyadobacter sp. BHUBP1 TaxID=3424178 RepID=UPI003D349CBE